MFIPNQDRYNIKLSCQFISNAVIAKAEITECISDLFQCNVFIHTNKLIEINKIINKKANISIIIEDKVVRYFTGIIDIASFENVPNIISNKIENLLYIRIVPTVTRLNFSQKYKIYQNKSPKEIVQSVLKDNLISDYKLILTGFDGYKSQLSVQYSESDWHFISRLLAQNGMFYYFRHNKDIETLIISNNSLSSDKIKTPLEIVKKYTDGMYPANGLINASMRQCLGYKSVNLKSYNENIAQIINSSSVIAQSDWEIGTSDFYDNIYFDKQVGDSFAKIELNSKNATVVKLTGLSYCPELYPGAIVTINGSTTKSHNGEFFLLSVKHYINQLDNNSTPIYYNSIEAIPQNTIFKVKNINKKNRIYGCQTATVVGPKGEEVYCDTNGRIKIKFHWNNDESCWVRTAQVMAGTKFGSLVLPRIGMEVLVEFVNGDPDQPIVVGCLYNGTHLTPGEYTKKATISTFYSHSIKGEGFNEIRINDEANAEEIYIHAQKDFNKEVENNCSETLTYGSKKITLESKNKEVEHLLLIKKGNNIININEGDYNIKIDKGNQKIELYNGNQNITLSKGNLTIDVDGNINIKSSKNINIEAKTITFESSGNYSIKSGSNINIKASDKYNLTASSISIKANSSLDLSGTNTSMKGSMALNLDSDMTTSISASVAVKISGGIIKLN